MNIKRVYFCCLYGNNEDEFIIRRIDRDMDYEELDNKMKRLKALIAANLGSSCNAVYEDANGTYTITCNPSWKV